MIAFKEWSEAELTRLARSHGSLTLVDRIPPEVFSSIFHYILHYSPPKERYRILDSLSQVSTKWQAMIANTPSLWSVINVWDDPETRSRALDRSGTCPLTVLCYHTAVLTDQPVPSERTRSLFTALMPHIERWKHIYIGQLEYLTDVEPFLQYPAPNIESFEIGRGGSGTYLSQLDLFGEDAPRLQEVFIMGTAIEWDSPVLHGLKFLTLSRLGQHPTPTEMLRILEHCPLLETFELSTTFRVDFPAEVYDAADLHGPVTLSHLKKLKIANVILDLLCSIFRNIRAPHCFDINLSTDRTYYETGHEAIAQVLQNALTPAIPTIHARLLQGGELQLSVCGIVISGDSVPNRRPAIRAKFTEAPSHLPALLQWLHQQLQPFQSVSLELTNRFSTISQSTQLALEGLSFVTRLSVNVGFWTEDILEFLAEPVVTAGVARWPFPSLRRLEIATNGERISILPMIESRHVVEEELVFEDGLVVDAIELPVPLEYLRVDNVSKREYRALNRLLGVGGLEVAVDPELDEEWDSDEAP